MAGKGGGGAWKVAYADFVTAMMAFFLVMWICGQDQQIKRAVSYYFKDPVGAIDTGNSAKPAKSGALSDGLEAGNIPRSEHVALGKGRKTYTSRGERSQSTKMVAEWLVKDKAVHDYWREEAQVTYEQARKVKEGDPAAAQDMALSQLARKLRDEVIRGVPLDSGQLYQELLTDAIAAVNWSELAEDLMGRRD